LRKSGLYLPALLEDRYERSYPVLAFEWIAGQICRRAVAARDRETSVGKDSSVAACLKTPLSLVRIETKPSTH
jgi:hypothetical protein